MRHVVAVFPSQFWEGGRGVTGCSGDRKLRQAGRVLVFTAAFDLCAPLKTELTDSSLVQRDKTLYGRVYIAKSKTTERGNV